MIRLSDFSLKVPDRILFDIGDFEFENDNSYLITGLNGCGKSTLFKAIIGFHKNYEGKIETEGNIVYQPQSIYLYQRTVRDNFSLLGVELKKLQVFFDELGIANLTDKSVNLLSGGERQKVALLRSLSLAEEILMLDEPFSQLDAKAVEKSLDMVLNWRKSKKGRLLLVISHNKFDHFGFDKTLRLP